MYINFTHTCTRAGEMGVSGAAEKVEKVRDGERLGLRWVAVKLVLRKSAELDRIPCWRRRCC